MLAGDQAGLSSKEIAQVNEMLATMTSRYGYCRECAKSMPVRDRLVNN